MLPQDAHSSLIRTKPLRALVGVENHLQTTYYTSLPCHLGAATTTAEVTGACRQTLMFRVHLRLLVGCR